MSLTEEQKKVAEEFPDILAVAQKQGYGGTVNKMANQNVPLDKQSKETLKQLQQDFKNTRINRNVIHQLIHGSEHWF